MRLISRNEVSGQPTDDRLLAYIRVAAAGITLALFAFTVIDNRDPTIVGMLFGALAVLLGLAGLDAINLRNGR